MPRVDLPVGGWRVLGAGALAAAAACAMGACAGRGTQPAVVLPAPGGVQAPPVAAPTGTAAGPRRGIDAAGDRRFLIVAVDDSTVSLLASHQRWLRPGLYGIAVDPRRRDALVARLYVQSRVADTAVALVTGQTTRMSTDYVAVFRRPSTPILRQPSFWSGLAAGVAVGASAVLAVVLAR